MTRFTRLLCSLLALFATSTSFASGIGVEGTPTLDVYWADGSGGPQHWAGGVQLTVDSDGNFSTGPQAFSWGQDSISLSFVSGNLDPVITMAVGFVDNGAPSTFTFAISSPLSPTITGTANYKLDLSGSFADGASDGGSMGSGIASFGIMDGQVNLTSFAGIGSPIGSFPAATSTPFGFSSVTGTVNCGVGCTNFGMLLSAMGSGGDDAMSFTGRLELNQVPVPGAIWLLGSAVGLLRLVRRNAA